MNAQLQFVKWSDYFLKHASKGAQVVLIGVLIMWLVSIALASFISAVDAYWLQDSRVLVVGTFLGLVMLYMARVFWRVLLRMIR